MVKKKIKNKTKKRKVVKNKKNVVIKKTFKKEGKLIGKITHYFSNIEVAVIKLFFPLKIGDTIRVIGGQETDFEQKIKSMQVNHKEIKTAKKGQDIGLKIKEKVHEGYKVYKV